MPTTVFLNGQYTTPELARVSALDSCFQHGLGVFETMLGGCDPKRVGQSTESPEGVWVVDLDEHLSRLGMSACTLGLVEQVSYVPLSEAIVGCISRSGLARARIRLTITSGDLNLLSAKPGSKPPTPTVLVVCQPATEYPAAMLQRGVTATIAETRANFFNAFESHKTVNYWWRLHELQVAGQKNAAEALVFDITTRLVGGCVSNAICVRDGEVFTPPTRMDQREVTVPEHPSATLPGITRQWAMNELAGLGTIVNTRHAVYEEVLDCEEIMLTNSSWGVLPITRVADRTIGTGTPGPIAQQLVERWSRHVKSASGV